MKSMSSAMRVLTVVLGISIAGCATSFSPERVRGEIATQTGQDPRYVFEIQLGRVTMHMIRAGLAGGGAALPLAGLNEFDLAFYDVPMGASLDSPDGSSRLGAGRPHATAGALRARARPRGWCDDRE